jgi:hypothetical protein
LMCMGFAGRTLARQHALDCRESGGTQGGLQSGPMPS